MRLSGLSPWPLVSTLPPLLLVLILVLVQVAEPGVGGEQTDARSQQKLPKLFDFENFKSLFKKQYGSVLEELSRRRHFMSRALRAFVSAVNYKFRRSAHYNAVNDMSDRSRDEVHKMRNKLMEQEDRANSKQQRGQLLAGLDEPEVGSFGGLPELMPAEGESVEGELLDLLKDYGTEPEISELREEIKLKKQRRRKRDLGANVSRMKPRDLPLDRLINTGQTDAPSPNAHAAKQKPILRNPGSNNPDYQSFELASRGLTDQQELVNWWTVNRQNIKSLGQQLIESLFEREQRMEPAERDKLPDEVFLDHRDQGCLMEPRQQGACGACYAFVVTTLMEWLLCQKSGKLVPLSEQYMIDCANGRYEKMGGCEGGSVLGSALFVHNFGLELQKNYPYFSRQSHCPIEEDFDLKRTGFIRMELGDAVNVHADLWERILKYSPLYMKARTGDDFIEYGGGVYRGQGCEAHTNHAMVLVGHGRQDGEQYWLLRNSMGTNWGERGYWKLAKAAATRCLDPNGVAFGTKTGTKFDVKPRNSNPKAKKA